MRLNRETKPFITAIDIAFKIIFNTSYIGILWDMILFIVANKSYMCIYDFSIWIDIFAFINDMIIDTVLNDFFINSTFYKITNCFSLVEDGVGR